MLRLRMGVVAAALLGSLGCEEQPRIIDPYPVPVDRSAGPLLAAGAAGDEEPLATVVDVLSPVTVLDRFRPGDELQAPGRRLVTLTLFGVDDTGAPTVPRARFPYTASLDIHPCADPNGLCQVGLDDQVVDIGGVIGADVLSRSAVRFDLPDGTMHFFPDVPGNDSKRGRLCDAVFPNPYAGGGTLLIAGSEVNYAANRPTLGACLDQAGAPTDEERGLDALLVLSTGLGPTILSESTYGRYASKFGAAPLADLPRGDLVLPSGPVSVALGTVDRMALVGEASDERGPCRELYANRLLSVDACAAGEVEEGTCPCHKHKNFCRTAAAVVIDRPIQVAVIADDAPLLQALRDELRPALPELDGVVGVDALSSMRMVLDYPNNRLILRCLETDNCTTRPQVLRRSSLDDLARCLPAN